MNVTQTIGVKKYLTGVTDSHGNPVESWTSPTPLPVYSIAPTSSREPNDAGREAVITGLEVLAPTGTNIGRLDRVVIGEDEYTVEGDIANWDQGPFGYAPGVSFALKRVDG